MDSQKGGGFFTFIMDAQEDKALLDDFNKLKTATDFKRFFLEKHPFYGLDDDELKRIIAYKEKLCGEETKGETRKEKNERWERVHDFVCGRGGGFFDFIIDAREDKALLDDFKKLETLNDFKRFFIEENPFYGLSEVEIERIVAHRNKLCKEKSKQEIYYEVCRQGY